MLEHFIGSYCLKQDHSQTNARSAIEKIGINLCLNKFVSENNSLVIYSSRIKSSRSSEKAPRRGENVAIALAGYLGLDRSHDNALPNSSNDEISILDSNSALLSKLNFANGTFALAAYDETESFLLATDSLGARPLYYAHHAGVIYFSTSFSLISKIYPGNVQLDKQAVAEQIKFCYPLGNRTFSSEISVLRDGECLIASNGNYSLSQYSDWRKISPRIRNRQQELENCSDAFTKAIYSRTTPGTTQYSLLSGGLDSRMIVAELIDENYSVVASNRSFTGSLDQQYCAEFAARNNVDVSYATWQNDRQTSAGMTTAHVLKSATSSLPASHVFSGDGGGEIFGFITIDKQLLEVLQTHGLANAINYYASRQTLSKSIVTTEYYNDLEKLALQGINSEFNRFEDIHPEKAFQLFFLLNELRRHLHDYFDSTDPEAKELLLPFYDRRVLESIIKITPPFEQYIGHKFYYDLIPYISSRIKSVAWQTYPWSAPCPVQSNCTGIDQWDLSKQTAKLEAPYWRKRTLKSLLTSRPLPFIRHSHIFATILFDVISPQSHSYIFKQYETIIDIFRRQ